VNEPKALYNESCKKPTIIQRGYIETPASDDKSLRGNGKECQKFFLQENNEGS
jgi:hypothetical protein